MKSTNCWAVLDLAPNSTPADIDRRYELLLKDPQYNATPAARHNLQRAYEMARAAASHLHAASFETTTGTSSPRKLSRTAYRASVVWLAARFLEAPSKTLLGSSWSLVILFLLCLGISEYWLSQRGVMPWHRRTVVICSLPDCPQSQSPLSTGGRSEAKP